MNYIEISQDLILNQAFDLYDITDIIAVLQRADDLYYNDDESFLSDAEYDAIRRYVESIDPSNPYFIGVGSEVRGGKVKLPYPMGSLDQIYENEIEDWISKHNLFGERIILSDKLDGASAMLVYDNHGNLQIAYSRGNGVEGADIYRHLSKFKSIPRHVDGHLVVRGEVILEVASFPWLKTQILNRAGKQYKNPRNLVSGLLNAKENNELVYGFLKFVAYEIIDSSMSKQEQLTYLDKNGFEVVHSLAVYGNELDDNSLTSYLNLRKQESHYEIDGLVLDVNSSVKRNEMNPTKETLNPAFALKYKITDVANLATTKVVRVDWNISKHGYIKPRVQIEPVELGGVTIEYTTGFNAKFIYENGIGAGAIVEITRSGDVIPFLKSVKEPSVAEMPTDIEWEWIENDNNEKVDIVIKNPNVNETVAIKRIVDFFEKIDAPMLKLGNVKKLYNAGLDTIEKIIEASCQSLVNVLGENGNKVYGGLRDKLSNIELYKIIGAHSTKRGIGIRRMKAIQNALGKDRMLSELTSADLVKIDGFDEKTSKLAIEALSEFTLFYNSLKDFINIADEEKIGSALAGEFICVTGFRDKELVAKIEMLGGTIQNNVNKKTTIVIAKNPTGNSSKLRKATEMDIPILSIEEFKNEKIIDN